MRVECVVSRTPTLQFASGFRSISRRASGDRVRKTIFPRPKIAKPASPAVRVARLKGSAAEVDNIIITTWRQVVRPRVMRYIVPAILPSSFTLLIESVRSPAIITRHNDEQYLLYYWSVPERPAEWWSPPSRSLIIALLLLFYSNFVYQAMFSFSANPKKRGASI